MQKYNAKNERIKREYLVFLKEARQQAEPTIDAVAKALVRFEEATRHKDFKAFHYEQAIAFKAHLREQVSQTTGEKLSKSTMLATLNHLKRFFQWLASQPGYRSCIQYTDADYFSLSAGESRVATAKRDKKAPTLEQVRHVIATLPAVTDIERRNRALIAFALLTGARDGAIASAKLKHIDLDASCFFQDARDVKTKFSKTFSTWFFPVGEDIATILVDWVNWLREVKLWGNDDPLFPSTLVEVGESRHYEVAGLERRHWSGAGPIRTIFRQAFVAAGLPYFNPHSLRDTLTAVGMKSCKDAEALKAWSQNLGHSNVMTTLSNYGEVESARQAEIIRGLSGPAPAGDAPPQADIMARAVLKAMREAGAKV